ncbi:MAG: cyclophilin-like fold protein [Planctomycetota bacterium]
MQKYILISCGSIMQKALLNDSETAELVHKALPFNSTAQLWGDEVYFEIPVSAKLSNPQELVEKGDIGYWDQGKCFCVFFGQTPISQKGEIRPASPVDVIGKLLGSPEEFSKAREGEPITVSIVKDKNIEAEAKVVAVCIGDKKGTRKSNIGLGKIICNFGVEGDSHASNKTHRQVCLLAKESIDAIRGEGYEVGPGDFAENITTEGINLLELPIGIKLKIGEALLEITQKGKECHDGCDVYKTIGVCIARQEAVFAKVISSGVVKTGDTIEFFKQ